MLCQGSMFKYLQTCVTQCPENAMLVNNICEACDPTCKSCAGLINTCTSCSFPKFKHEGKCQDGCPAGTTANSSLNVCEPGSSITIEKDDNPVYGLVYFPFLIITIIFGMISLGGYMKDNGSLIISNFVALLGMLEWILYIVQIAHSIRQGNVIVMAGTLLGFLALVA
jgi:hypothetical protein